MTDVAAIQARHAQRLERLARRADAAEAVSDRLRGMVMQATEPAELRSLTTAWAAAERVLRMNEGLAARLDHEILRLDNAAERSAREAREDQAAVRRRAVCQRAKNLGLTGFSEIHIHEATLALGDDEVLDEAVDVLLLRLCRELNLKPPAALVGEAIRPRDAEPLAPRPEPSLVEDPAIQSPSPLRGGVGVGVASFSTGLDTPSPNPLPARGRGLAGNDLAEEEIIARAKRQREARRLREERGWDSS